eukprot:6491886-Amphidinium_carterae.3
MSKLRNAGLMAPVCASTTIGANSTPTDLRKAAVAILVSFRIQETKVNPKTKQNLTGLCASTHKVPQP